MPEEFRLGKHNRTYACGISALMITDYFGIYLENPSIKLIIGVVILLFTYVCLLIWTEKKVYFNYLSILWIVPSGILVSYIINHIYPDLVISACIIIMIGFIISSTGSSKSLPILSGLVYALLTLAQVTSPLINNIVNKLSHWITYVLSFGMGSFGESMGLIIPFLSFLIAVSLIMHGKRLIFGLFLITAAMSLHCIILTLILVYTSIGAAFIPVFIIISLVAFLIFEASDKQVEPEDNRKALKKGYLLCLLCVSGMLTLLYIPVRLPQHNAPDIRIGVIGGKEIDLSTAPENTDTLGYAYTNSLYGAFLLYLNNSGFKTIIYDNLDNVNYDEIDQLVLINYNKGSNSKERLKEFIKKGGSLFVFADHTNIMGVADGINPLIDYSGIFLRKDTSDDIDFYKHMTWENNLYSWFQQGFNTTVSQAELQVWGGASVGTNNLMAIPILRGRYSTSDPEDISNTGYGGFLGNRKFDIGEAAGDMSLIMQSYYGKGKVTLFGDTSYIQTPVLACNWKYISSIFSDFTPNSVIIFLYIMKTLIVVFMLVSILIIFVKRKIEPKAYYYAVFSCFMAAFLVLLVNNGLSDYYNNDLSKLRSDSFAYINNDEFNSIAYDALESSSILGLGYNAIKNKIPMMIDNEYHGKAVFILHPNKQMTNSKQRDLLNYINRGGVVIISADKEYMPSLILEEIGVRVTDQFLGPIPWRYPNLPDTMTIDSPDFKYAWNLSISDSNKAVPWITYKDYILAARSTYGKGLCYIFADSNYFDMSNLEGETTGNQYNIKVVNNLFSEINQHAADLK